MTVPATSIGRPRTAYSAPPLRIGSILADRFAVDRAVTTRSPQVYRARDLATGRDVAVKVLPLPPERADAFVREVGVLAELAHPNLVTYVARGPAGAGLYYSVEEWLDGLTLAERLDVVAVPAAEMLAIAERIARALAAAHACGVVHGNVTASNVLCVATAPPAVKLIDFGIARGAVGSRAADPRTDVFALGCLLSAHIPAGELPFHVAGIVRRLLAGAPLPAAAVADALAEGSKHEARTRRESVRRCVRAYAAELAPGAMCGDYVIERAIGRGGCGRVYRARHRVLRREAAVKVLEPELAVSGKTFQRFVFEAQAANRVRHPAIVDVHDFGRLPDGRPYFAMELLAGETLEQRLSASSRLRPSGALAIVDQLAGALAAVHAAGIVHRDIKPSNVFLEGDRVRLMDFGIAKLVEPDPDEPTWITTATSRVGTPEAMAPEQIRGQPVDARTDIYGLGVLAYRMLTGRWPFVAVDDTEVERLHLEAMPLAPSSLVALPAGADAAILRCLAKDPADRFQRVDEVAAALRCLATA
jgi:serine/threonine protein kinase